MSEISELKSEQPNSHGKVRSILAAVEIENISKVDLLLNIWTTDWPLSFSTSSTFNISQQSIQGKVADLISVSKVEK